MEKIVELEREKWEDHPLRYSYTTRNHWAVGVTRTGDDFSVSFAKKAFAAPQVKNSHPSDRLFKPWFDGVRAWGIVADGRLLAAVETAVEEWNNRLRVTHLWVDESLQRRGIGTALMDTAVARAKDERRRVLVLETQSCNETAIAFYLAYGLSLTGFDTCDYSNDDIARGEVRLEFGMIIESDNL